MSIAPFLAALALAQASSTPSPTPVAQHYHLLGEPRWQLDWKDRAVPGSDLLAADGSGVWTVNLRTGFLMRLGSDLRPAGASPLPKSLTVQQPTPRQLHLAGFGASGVWVLDIDRQELWRYEGKVWSGPMSPGVEFVSGAAWSQTKLLVNVPNADQPIVLLDQEGRVVQRAGNRVAPPYRQLEEEYGTWACATTDDGWISAHRYLDLLERFRKDGSLVWQHSVGTVAARRLDERRQAELGKATFDPSGCCIDVSMVHFTEDMQIAPDGAVVLNLSAAPAFVRLDGSGTTQEELILDGADSIDRFGFAMTGDYILVSFQGELRAWRRASAEDGPVGVVLDEAGNPIAVATVLLDAGEAGVQSVFTDSDGRFSLPAVDQDRAVTLAVSARGFLDSQMAGTLRALLAEPIMLEARPRVCVVVTSAATDKPVTEFQLEVQRSTAGGNPRGVNISVEDGPTRLVKDDRGEACLDTPWKGPFLIMVGAKGFARSETRVTASEKPVVVTLRAEARLHAVVRNAAENPVAGVSLSLLDPDEALRPARRERFTAETNADGVVLFTEVPPGEWEVWTSSPSPENRRLDRRRAVLESGDNDLEIKLGDRIELQVSVLDTASAGVPGVSVEVVPAASVPTDPAGCRTGELGRCTLSELEPGRYTLQANPTERMALQREIEITPAPKWQEAELRYPDDEDIEGRLIGVESYAPLRLTVDCEGDGWILTGVPVGEGGEFVLRGARAASSLILVVRGSSDDGEEPWTIAARNVTLPDGDNERLEVQLPPPLRVAGSVQRGGGRPCAGCSLHWSLMSGVNAPGGWGRTSPDGKYSVLLPMSGDYAVTIVTDDRAAHVRQAIVTESGERDFRLGRGAISGSVVDKETREPVASSEVTLGQEDDGSVVGSTYTGTDGSFRFDGLEAGAYHVFAVLAKRSGEASIRVGDDSETNALVELAGRGSIDLVLRDGINGAPLQRYSVRIYDSAGMSLTSAFGQLTADGRLSLPVASEGPFTVVVAAWGFGPVTVHGLVPASEPRVVQLLPACRLRLETAGDDRGVFAILDGQGRPVALDPEVPPGEIQFAGPLTLLERAPGGTYTVRYAGDGAPNVHQWIVTLKPGQDTVVRLDAVNE